MFSFVTVVTELEPSKLYSKYVFAGYSVRQGLSVMMTNMDGKMVYDVFLYSYVDNYLSMYFLMENGNYKCLNYEAPNENHKESYEKLFKDICLEQVTVESE